MCMYICICMYVEENHSQYAAALASIALVERICNSWAETGDDDDDAIFCINWLILAAFFVAKRGIYSWLERTGKGLVFLLSFFLTMLDRMDASPNLRFWSVLCFYILTDGEGAGQNTY